MLYSIACKRQYKYFLKPTKSQKQLLTEVLQYLYGVKGFPRVRQ